MLNRAVSAEWSRLLASLGVKTDGVTVVAGSHAVRLADSLQASGVHPIAGAADEVVVCAETEGYDLEGAIPSATGLPGDSADLVVLAHAWDGRTTLAPVLEEAMRIARPGAGIVACEFDLGRILRSRPAQYPAVLLYSACPDVAATVAARHVDPGFLEMSVVNAGIRGGQVTRFERTVRVAPVDEYLADVSVRGWRGADEVDADEADDILGQLGTLAEKLAGDGVFTETEPWVVVRGWA
ncbi:MAG: hypothetical protein HKN01_06150 [Acidimicrobiia bacterium]|nr:hypothetical protein [Acidimicrobiia bacterium]